MPVSTTNFDTGPSTLPDLGRLKYNGVIFSPLFATTLTGTFIKDAANRTVKYIEYTLTVDGYVTAPAPVVDSLFSDPITPTMRNLYKLLSEQGADLEYIGRGHDLTINTGGAGIDRDVAWGPVPEVLEFQPLGMGLCAKIRWQVKARVPRADFAPGAVLAGKLLQFNYDTTVTYGEDGYSTLSMKGTLEIPLTRNVVGIRTVPTTADALRGEVESRLMSGIDLSRFRVTKRTFSLSRDKRTLEWDFQIEEKGYMDPPENCTVARGSYTVRPAKAGMGLVLWLCTLRATYTVRHDKPRRVAWIAFLNLLRFRMAYSKMGAGDIDSALRPPARFSRAAAFGGGFISTLSLGALPSTSKKIDRVVPESRRAFLIDFNIDEGIYNDSKTVTFSATWKLVTMFSHILLASGIWTKLPETEGDLPAGKNLWAISMKDVQGAQSWLQNRADPALDVIVDFGS